MRIWLVGLLAMVATGQERKGPPEFAADDPEGLLVTRNATIRHAWKRKVFWKMMSGGTPGSYGGSPLPTVAEKQQMTSTLNALVALFQATPTGTNGEGFWVGQSRTLGGVDVYETPVSMPLARIPHRYEVGLFPFYHEDVFGNGAWKLSVAGETESVYFHFNRLPGRMEERIVAQEDRGPNHAPVEFYLRPVLTGRWNGLPIYGNQALVVARAERDPWAVAPLGRVLKAALPLYEKDRKAAEDRLASYRKRNEEVQAASYEQQMWERFEKENGALKSSRPSNYEARRGSLVREIAYNRQKAAMEANPGRDEKGRWYWNPIEAHEAAVGMLAALDAGTAAGPACFAEVKGVAAEGRYSMPGTIVPEGGMAGCREIVSTNWDYFDLKLARAAPQILTVPWFGRCAKVVGGELVSEPVKYWSAPPQGCVQHARMWRELDWAQFAALVAP